MKSNKYYYFLIILVLFIYTSCKNGNKQEVNTVIDDSTIIKMYLKDIEIRELDAKYDTINLEVYDKIHRDKVLNMLANNQVKTPMDKYRAALILQHTAGKICDGQLTSVSPENFLLAFHLSSSALSQLKLQNDTLTIKKNYVPRMVALNYDRYLLFTSGYQKFGTQFVFDDKTGKMLLAPVDTTLSNDKERKEYNVESLKYLLSKFKMKQLIK